MTANQLETEIERIARSPQPSDEEITWRPATNPGGSNGLKLCAQLRGALFHKDPEILIKDPEFLDEFDKRAKNGEAYVKELTHLAENYKFKGNL